MFYSSRRSLLLGVAGSAAAAMLPSAVFAEQRLAKLRPAAAPAATPETAPRRLKLYNTGTKETFDREYHKDGALIGAAQDELDWFLRDFHENQAMRMNPALFDQLWRFQQRLARAGFGAGPLWIHSAYRTQKTNDSLRREGAAHNSRHLIGEAADVSVPGHGIFNYERIAEWSSTGGLGLYYWDHFVHFDVGPRRYWSQAR